MNENRRLTEIWERTDGDDLILCVCLCKSSAYDGFSAVWNRHT